MNDEEKYPEGNCIAIYPKGKDEVVIYMGQGCERWHLIAHTGTRFLQLLAPGMDFPITITTQIQRIEGMPTFQDDWLVNEIKLRPLPKHEEEK